MKIVIDIPKKAYENIKAEKEIDWLGVEYILDCIKNGTPLNKEISKEEQTDGDLISRQAVKDLIRGLTKWSVKSQDRKYVNVGLLYDDVMFGIDRLPSAEKTDGDLISRKAVITMLQKIENAVEDGDGFQFNEWVEYAKDIPSAEKMAEWIKQKSGDELFPEEIVCSKCYHSNSHLDFDEHNNPIGKLFLKSKYCPNCGAKMKESKEKEE